MMPASLARARLGFTRKGLMRGEGGRDVTMDGDPLDAADLS